MTVSGTHQSLPRSCRIHQKKDFTYLREKSAKGFQHPLVLYSKPSRLGFPHARLGLSVSGKFGSAVWRNRIKRILRDEFRRHPARHQLPLDLLAVIARKPEDELILREAFRRLISAL